MFPGWTIPASDATPDYRAEIETHAVDPCYLDSIRRQDDLAGNSEQEMLMLVKALQLDTTEDMINSLLPLVQGQDEATRSLFYAFALKACIKGARGE